MTSVQESGHEFYLSLVQKGADFLVLHKHLKVLTLDSKGGSVVINQNWLDNSTTHIYVVGIKNNDCFQIGGIPKTTLLDKSVERGNLLHIQQCYFERDYYYNHNDLAQENETLSPKSVEHGKVHLTYFCTPDLQIKFEVVKSAGVSLPKLLENRLEVLKNFDMNHKHLHGSNQDRQISQELAMQNNEFILDNTLFDRLGFSGDSEAKKSLHHLSQKLMEFFVLEGCEDDLCVQWIALQEERILRYQLASQYQTESDILIFLEANKLLTRSDKNKETKLHLEKNLNAQIKTECSKLFSLQFPGLELPSRWFSCNICACLELGLESLSGSRIQVVNGRAYFSYKHIAEDWLPKALVKYITLPREQVKRFWSDPEKRRLSTTGLKIRKEVNSVRASPSSSVDLPDIEDTAHLFPPCAKMLHSQLTESNVHLNFKKRNQLIGFLTDVGWKYEKIIKYYKTHELKCGVSEQLFDTKYAQIAKRPFIIDENGKRRFGRDKAWMSGLACDKLTKEIGSSDDCCGCPMRFMDQPKLESFLTKQYGIAHLRAPEVLALSAQRKYQSACAKAFEIKFNGFLYTGNQPWVPASPHGFLFHAIRRTSKN